jgi:uncharacterized short protein YbdD (DUF466 family)
MHDFDQFVENLNDDHLKFFALCKNNNYNELKVKKRISQFKGASPNQMLKFYVEFFKYNKT